MDGPSGSDQASADAPGVHLAVDGAIATITNRRPDRHNAFDDAMDRRLVQVLDTLAGEPEVRAVIWRGDGPSFSSGRDVASIAALAPDESLDDVLGRSREIAARLLDLPIPVIAALHGWVMGVSFQRALLCDLRIAAEGTRFRLPELQHGFIPDSGGVARLFQMCGHGVAGDLVLTGRVMDAAEAFGHGIVSRVVPADELDATAREMAEAVAAVPSFSVATARGVLRDLAVDDVTATLATESAGQAAIASSDDYAELRRARRERRAPVYRGT